MNLHPMLIVAFGTLVSLYISFWSFRNFDRNMFKRQSILYIAIMMVFAFISGIGIGALYHFFKGM